MTRRRPASRCSSSAPAGIESSLATGDFGWLRALRGVLRRAGSRPGRICGCGRNTTKKRWLDAWPMTRAGLSRMAKDLAGIERASRPFACRCALLEQSRRRHRAHEASASVVPHPRPGFSKSCARPPPTSRRRHPASAAARRRPATPVVRLSDEEVRLPRGDAPGNASSRSGGATHGHRRAVDSQPTPGSQLTSGGGISRAAAAPARRHRKSDARGPWRRFARWARAQSGKKSGWRRSGCRQTPNWPGRSRRRLAPLAATSASRPMPPPSRATRSPGRGQDYEKSCRRR